VDEEDVPAVARTLLKAAASAGHLDSGSATTASSSSKTGPINSNSSSSSNHLGLLRRAVAAVRAQGALLSSAPLAVLLMDVLAQHLPLSSGASRAFLQEAVGASARAASSGRKASRIGWSGADRQYDEIVGPEDEVLEGGEDERGAKHVNEQATNTSRMDGPTVFDAAVLVLLLQQPQHAPPLGNY